METTGDMEMEFGDCYQIGLALSALDILYEEENDGDKKIEIAGIQEKIKFMNWDDFINDKTIQSYIYGYTLTALRNYKIEFQKEISISMHGDLNSMIGDLNSKLRGLRSNPLLPLSSLWPHPAVRHRKANL